MSEHDTGRAVVDADFAGRRRRFCLRLGEMGELERLTGQGVGAIIMHLGARRFSAAEVWDTIRLGLEGGGTAAVEASALVVRYQDQPITDFLPLASHIVAAAVSGVPAAQKKGGSANQRPPGDLSVFYASGAVVGWTPRDIDRLTLSEFGAAIDGWMAAHAPREEVDVTEDEFAQVLAEEMAAGRA